MSATDDLLVNARRYAETFDKGDLPLPPALGVAVVACMDARLNVDGLLGLEKRSGARHMQRRRGDTRRDPFIPRKDQVRGFVYDVFTGQLREVTR